MEMNMIYFELVLNHERPVILADINAITKLGNNFAFNEENKLKNILNFFWDQVPWLLNVPLRDHQKVPVNFARITKNYLGMLVFLEHTISRITKRAIWRFLHILTIPNFYCYAWLICL